MSAIKDKITKLLALAGSPNEAEAKAALLKARELMAKYKLREEECGGEHDDEVIIDTIGVECTTMTDPWALTLACIISEHYCCKTFHRRYRRGKKVTVGFAGLKDDFEICKNIYLYAYNCVIARCKNIRAKYRSECGASELRKMCNSFGWGFCLGLDEAYQAQEAEHQEWGLVLVVPKAVNDAMDNHGMKPPASFGKMDDGGWRSSFASAGYDEGKKFVPSQSLCKEEH